MLLDDKNAATHETRGGRRPYRTQVAGALAAAFALSLAYSVIVTFTGSHEGYGMADPALWVFYAVGFGLAALALTDRRWAWCIIAATVLALIALGIFYYPTVFPPSAQTTLAWLENDVYMGLLILAEYLCVQRLRNVDITAGVSKPREATNEGDREMSRAGESSPLSPGCIGRQRLTGRVLARGAKFEAMIRNLYGPAQGGNTDAKGIPNLLQVALIAREFQALHRRLRFGMNTATVVSIFVGFLNFYRHRISSQAAPSGAKQAASTERPG